jgi:hypothetical protein
MTLEACGMKLRHLEALVRHTAVYRELDSFRDHVRHELERDYYLYCATIHKRGLHNWRHLDFHAKLRRVRSFAAEGLLQPPDVVFFIVGDLILGEANESVLRTYASDLADRFDALDRCYGLNLDDGDCWPIGEEPEDRRALARQFDEKARQLLVEAFHDSGEPQMGDLFVRDRPAFDARFKAGRTRVAMVNAEVRRVLPLLPVTWLRTRRRYADAFAIACKQLDQQRDEGGEGS